MFEIRVRWIDDPVSRVQLLKTAKEDVGGILRLRKTILNGRFTKPSNRQVASEVSRTTAFDSKQSRLLRTLVQQIELERLSAIPDGALFSSVLIRLRVSFMIVPVLLIFAG